MADTVTEILTEEKQEELIINKSKQDNCERVWVVVYNPTEVEELIIVNMLTTWKN